LIQPRISVSLGGDVAQQARQHGPAAMGAGGVLLEHGGAAGGAQLVELRIGALFVDRPSAFQLVR
jgi:hypothetical protein